MKKQLLGLLIIFSAASCCKAEEKPSTSTDQLPTADSQLQKQTELLEHQNKILTALLTLQYEAAVQKEEEKKNHHQQLLRKQAAAQANKPWIDKKSIMNLSMPDLNLEYPKNENCPLANQANMFYDNPLDPQSVAVLLAIDELIIDTFDSYLWPTIRSIVINRIATKIASTALEKIDEVADNTIGIRPWEMLSSLTPTEREHNQLLRSTEISKLMAKMKNLQQEVAPEELKKELTRKINELKNIARQQDDERTARANSGIPATGSNERRESRPTAEPTVEEVD
ncbi:MAG: hypothetical protein WC747_03825 [Candidatus Babeliales bacterium]|jgi:hypothetical protein